MDEELDVVVTEFDAEPRQAEAGLVRMFGLDPQSARRLLRELPIVARRQASHATAERYVAALRSIGARVELRPTDLTPQGAGGVRAGSSLPEPLSSAMAGLHESLRVDREADSAIARFRASEGLDTLEHFEGGLDLANPAIPRAPAIPHDLAHMPNAALPRFSDRPDWGSDADSVEPRPHTDAQRPLAGFVASPARDTRDKSATQPPGDPKAQRAGAVGLARVPTTFGRPGLGSQSAWPKPNDSDRRRARWPLALGGCVIAISALWLSGVLGSTEARRLDAWHRQGIEAGEHAAAVAWLAAANHDVEGVAKDAVQELVGRLTRAGTRAIFAIQIQHQGASERARSLLVELPDDPALRRTIFWYAARARGQRVAPEVDTGQRYYLLSFH